MYASKLICIGSTTNALPFLLIIKGNILRDHLIDLRRHLLLHLLPDDPPVDDHQDEEADRHQYDDEDDCGDQGTFWNGHYGWGWRGVHAALRNLRETVADHLEDVRGDQLALVVYVVY